MRWMAAYVFTALIVVVLTFLFWLRTHQLGGLAFPSDVLQWMIPDGAALWIRRFQVPLIFGIWALLRTILQWTVAYSTSEVEGSPRNDRRLNRFVGGLYTLFYNPTRWWIASYAALIGSGMAIIGAYIWVFDQSVITRSAWALSTLLAMTLAAMIVNPDDPEVARQSENTTSEPLLEAPME